jgi:hypothetical protein
MRKLLGGACEARFSDRPFLRALAFGQHLVLNRHGQILQSGFAFRFWLLRPVTAYILRVGVGLYSRKQFRQVIALAI